MPVKKKKQTVKTIVKTEMSNLSIFVIVLLFVSLLTVTVLFLASNNWISL